MASDRPELEMVVRMKSEGHSGREIGYAVTASIFNAAGATELAAFAEMLNLTLSTVPGDEFTAGSLDWLEQELAARKRMQ